MSKQERATRTRNALIRSAAGLFEQHGYVQTGLTAISSGAEVSRGALTFHFENKAAVARAVEQSAVHVLRRAARRATLWQGNAVQAMADMSHGFAYLLTEDVVVRAGFRLNCDWAQGEIDLRREWQGCVQSRVTRAAADGALRPDAELEDLVNTVTSATLGMEILGRRDREWLSRRTVTGFWQQMLFAACTEQARAATDPKGGDEVLEQIAEIHRRFAPYIASPESTPDQ
ncbi:ScbR family autoregulator-binding transcription factor [Kitasatospora sp. NPDC004614]|uniref:ScbR family autoregulator-binding transcription factor n=1 Tax=unclassified Kitasatospora TaxID=2633591 RepID=UPI0036C8A625